MSVNFRGTQATIRKLQQFGRAGEQRIKQITGVSAQEIVSKAASNLSAYNDVDQDGKIAQSINAIPINDGLTWEVSVNQVPMAAYVEFGTGVFVDVPSGWENLAMAFYVNGKGYTTPHPYLYPAYYAVRTQYKKDLKNALDDLISRTNRT